MGEPGFKPRFDPKDMPLWIQIHWLGWGWGSWENHLFQDKWRKGLKTKWGKEVRSTTSLRQTYLTFQRRPGLGGGGKGKEKQWGRKGDQSYCPASPWVPGIAHVTSGVLPVLPDSPTTRQILWGAGMNVRVMTWLSPTQPSVRMATPGKCRAPSEETGGNDFFAFHFTSYRISKPICIHS